MNICSLCLEREANKKNTHYLTDSIIRTCLNIDGTNEREKGLYFSLDNTNPFIEFNFQRLDELTLEQTIGRKPTEEEIESAKSIPYSVDYIFCSQCEDRFSEIETEFSKSILPLFRQANLQGVSVVENSNLEIIRNFFYIQIFRSAICEKTLRLSKDFIERLRLIILNKEKDITIPLNITYLQTIGGKKVYTENYVGYTSDQNPYIILMNDFIIQVYENEEDIAFIPFYGLNTEDTYNSNINRNEEQFKFIVFNDEQRKKLLLDIMLDEKVKQTIEYHKNSFDLMWFKLFKAHAPTFYKEHYVQSLVNIDPNNILKHTKEEIQKFTIDYFAKLFNV